MGYNKNVRIRIFERVRRMIRKKSLLTGLVSLTFGFGLCLGTVNQYKIEAVTDEVTAQENKSDEDAFLKIYNEGRSKGILTDENMPKDKFIKFCKDYLFPEYLKFIKENSNMTFEQYVAMDNYDVPVQTAEDHPEEVEGRNIKQSGSSLFTNFIAAKSGYKMKAGDILICYGTFSSSIPSVPGHAAIATSENYILEMPGTAKKSKYHNAQHVTKKEFFTAHTKGNDYVSVYRIKKHPVYADKASTYAYRFMYKNDNPTYSIANGMNPYVKSPSYCSKYVYYAYWKGATKSSVKQRGNYYLFWPHFLQKQFSKSFHPYYMYKITKY